MSLLVSSMAHGVDGAAIVCCFMTSDYSVSDLLSVPCFYYFGLIILIGLYKLVFVTVVNWNQGIQCNEGD